RLEPGFALFSSYASLKERLGEAQLVLTGEGAIDRATVMGRGVGELARWCRQTGVPCLGFGGALVEPRRAKELFTGAYAITPDLTTRQEAIGRPAYWLAKLAENVAREWKG